MREDTPLLVVSNYMKNITLQSVQVREIRYRPTDSQPNVVLFYDVLDDDGQVVGEKSAHIPFSELPNNIQAAITSYHQKLSDLVTGRELDS